MIETDRLIASEPLTQQEETLERALRPKVLDEYVGQEKARGQLEIFINAARGRSEALDHVLLFGPPGLGKTTLAGPSVMAAPLAAGDIAAASAMGVLLSAMEDYRLDIMIGEGPAARSVRLDLPPFTLVGATTRAGMLTNPLRDRFGIVSRLEFYTSEELSRIVHRSAGLLEVSMQGDGALEIAKRSRGTPRIANRLLRRVRDYAQVKSDGIVTSEIADAALKMLDVDHLGFDVMDRKLLLAVLEKFAGGPVGLDNLAAAIGEERDTIEDVLEPYLIQQGYLMRTPRGRVATQQAYQHFGLPIPKALATGELWASEDV